MKFRGELQLSGKTATGIEVPEGIVTGLGAGKRPAVRVTIGDGHTYRTTIAPMGVSQPGPTEAGGGMSFTCNYSFVASVPAGRGFYKLTLNGGTLQETEAAMQSVLTLPRR